MSRLTSFLGGLWGSSGRSTSHNPENPSVSLSDPEVWDALTGGGSFNSQSGVKVNTKTALSHDALWRGLVLISGTVAKTPFDVMKIQPNGDTEIDRQNPVQYLVRRKANDVTTAFVIKQVIQSHASLYGNGYGYIFRRGDGMPESWACLDPLVTFPIKVNGELWYNTMIDAEQIPLRAADVVHIRELGQDTFTGYNVMKLASDSIGLSIGARRFESRFFSNSARPAVVLEAPGSLKEEDAKAILSGWNRMHQGLDNVHRTAILHGGMTARALGQSAKDTQLLETRQFSITELANFLGVPQHKLGAKESKAYNSVAEENRSFLVDAIDRWLTCWEEELTDKMLPDDAVRAGTLSIMANRESLERADIKSRTAFYRAGLGGAAWLKMNEVRRENNKPSVPGGDVIVQPAAFTGSKPPSAEPEPEPEAEPEPDANEEPKPEPEPEPKPEAKSLDAAHRALLVDAAGRMIRRLHTQAAAAEKKGRDRAGFLAEHADDHESVVRETLLPVVRASGFDESYVDMCVVHVRDAVALRRTEDAARIITAVFGEGETHGED